MDHLPFLVAYGGWVWKVAALAFMACAYAAWVALRRWRSRARGRAVLLQIGTPAQELGGVLDGSVMVIEGTLRGDGECERYVDGRAAAAASFWWGRHVPFGPSTEGALHRRAPGLRIDTEHGPVELRGGVMVLVGSTELARSSGGQLDAARARLCQDAGCESAPAVWSDRPSHRWVSDGDRVVARGVLQRTAGSSAPADYRGDAGSLALWPDGNAGAVALAFARAPKLAAPTLRQRVGAVIGGAVLFMIGSYLLGSCAVKQSKDDDYRMAPRGGPFHLPSVDWLTVAAATPFHRADALDQIAEHISWRDTPEQDRLDAALAIDELRGDCLHAALLLEQHSQYREALTRNASCRSPDWSLQARAHAALAEFGPASDALEKMREHQQNDRTGRSAIAIHLLARRWSRAADDARAEAAFWRDEGKGPRSEIWMCLALAFDAKAGKPEALGEMRTRREPGAREACPVLRAELTRQPDDLEALDALSIPDDKIGDDYVRDNLFIAREYLLIEYRPELLNGFFLVGLRGPSSQSLLNLLEESTGSFPELGLVVRIVKRLPEQAYRPSMGAWRRWNQLRYLVVATAHVGAYDQAANYMTAASAALPSSDDAYDELPEDLVYYWLRVGQIDRVLSLLQDSEVSSNLPWFAALIRGDVEPYVQHVFPSYAHTSFPKALQRAASTRDGASLQGRLFHNGPPGRGLLAIFARHIQHNRGPLHDFARLAVAPETTDPTPWLVETGSRLRLAEALGDDQLAAEYRALAGRHFDAVTEPEIALFLYLLGF